MRIFFACLVLTAAALTGCYDMHGSPPVIPMGDAGPMPTDDAGLPVIEPDGGPVVTVDAGPVVETALRIVFDGPADSAYLRGSQDVVMYHVTLTAYENVEIRRMPYMLEGLTASDLIVGSSGTEYFRDHKIKDADTGATLAGPGSLPTLPYASSASGPMEFGDSFVVRAGETRHLLVTMDVANTEDAVNELFDDGNNRYRVTVGASDGHFFPLDGVRRVADGSFVEPEAIENNVVISGNEMTIVDAELAVSMAAMPALTTAVSHEPLIPSVGITFTASGASSVLIRSVRLSGVGDLEGAASPDLLNDVITSCALFDGDVQVGLAQSPDAGSGTMRITNVNVTVPAGSSLTLVARCTADSVVSGEYDTYNLGIANASDVEGEREDGFPVVSALGLGLIANANAGGPNFVTVYVHGDVTVETNNLRQSTILVAGGDVWHNFAQFRVTALHEDIVMEVVRVTSRGEPASFTMVGVAADGRVLGTGILPVGTDSERDITLSSPLTIPRYSSRVFQLWGKLANVVSSASVGGATRGVSLSGNLVRLGLAADVESGDWDSSYAGMLNLRFRGTASGDRMTANGPELLGNEFVIRRTKPTFTRQALSTTTLTSGIDMDLHRFQISADSAGSVGLIGFRFQVDMRGSFSVENWRLRRGATDVPLADISITYMGPPSNFVTIVFANEEIITGSGVGYTLHGTITGPVLAGDYISIRPYRDTHWTISCIFGCGVGADLALDSGHGTPIPVGLLWSDLSEAPHSYAERALGGSADWIGDFWVEDLTQTSTLSR